MVVMPTLPPGLVAAALRGLALVGLLAVLAVPARAQTVAEKGIPATGAQSGLPAFSKRLYVTTGQGYDPAQIPTYRLSSMIGSGDGVCGNCFTMEHAFPELPVVGSVIEPRRDVMGKHMGWYQDGIAHKPYFLLPQDDNEDLVNECLAVKDFFCWKALISYGDEAALSDCTFEGSPYVQATMSAAPVMLLDVDRSYAYPIAFHVKYQQAAKSSSYMPLYVFYSLAIQAPDGTWRCDSALDKTRLFQLQPGRYKIHLRITTHFRDLDKSGPNEGENSKYWPETRKTEPLPEYRISIRSALEDLPYPAIGDWALLPPAAEQWDVNGGDYDAKVFGRTVFAGPAKDNTGDTFSMTCSGRTYVFAQNPTLKLSASRFAKYEELKVDAKWAVPGPPQRGERAAMLLVFGPLGLVYSDGGKDAVESYDRPTLGVDVTTGCDRVGVRPTLTDAFPLAGDYAVWVGLRSDLYVAPPGWGENEPVLNLKARLVPRR